MIDLVRFLLGCSRRTVLASTAAGAAGGVAGVALIALVRRQLDGGAPAPAAAMAFLGLCVLAVAMRVASQVAMVRLGQGAVRELTLRVVRRTLRLPLREFESIDTAGLLATLTQDVVVLANALSSVPQFAINVPIVAASVAYVGWLSPLLFLCGVSFAALAVAAYMTLARRAIRELRAARRVQDRLVAAFQAMGSGSRELRQHDGRRRALLHDSLEPASAELRDRSVRAMATFAIADAWSQLAFFGFIGFVLFAAPRIQPIPTGTLAAAVLVVLYLMTPLDVIINGLPAMGRARVALGRIRALVPAMDGDEPEAAASTAEARPAFRESLRLDGVTFRYREGADDREFRLGPVDLELRAGEVVFLAGGNGSGKTTLAKLISGLYEPEAGAVLVDGQPVGDDDQAAYRSLFSVVFADGHLFGDYRGLPGAPDELARRAGAGLRRLELAGRVEVDGESRSFSTLDLSQGQRRRLALLGALLEDRPILVVDEWAANQDPTFKSVFYHRILHELRAAGKTLLVVSHDETYFEVADRVLRLSEGRVVEETPAAPDAIWPGTLGRGLLR
ncbi:ABC transporter ATP-binding protein YojI [Aquisphaera giovannonii]|uniref:ABC transporter ATP-binding protein YojI n=1 Tax=Aquisphaera giovannonii TaxID=406548 RepID=A0A5B9W3A3_9BACT|nr:cyclic peptide export ABC transporter [Aquisphaera giovannonii]QEH34737.1 ABC transporter ATP-binding protein YojI [Aquisphaera giovannonii]